MKIIIFSIFITIFDITPIKYKNEKKSKRLWESSIGQAFFFCQKLIIKDSCIYCICAMLKLVSIIKKNFQKTTWKESNTVETFNLRLQLLVTLWMKILKYKVKFEKQKLHESLVRKDTNFIIQFRFIYRFVWRKNL